MNNPNGGPSPIKPNQPPQATKPRLAVFKFASCDGCQLALLDAENELLALAGQVEIAYFVEASRRTLAGPYDVSLVEGAITTPEEAERIQEVR
ncbi:MAG: oxidoreductase, partial [Anaerolineae bacterium]|nr:oxidoreductase [Anaerolineae bacterium]